MPVLLEKHGIVKCHICDLRAEYECAICHNYFCSRHIRFGRLYGYNISTQNEYYCICCWRVERNTLLKFKTSKISIISGLRKLGISQADVLLVQASVSAFGAVEEGAESLIDAILLAIGKSGALVMPTFTPTAKRFHPASSIVDRSCGILPELFRRRRKTTRSANASLSFTALGKNAVFIINNAIAYERLDQLSPVYRLMQKNGKILMLGVEYNNSIPIIFAETVMTANCQRPNISCGKKYQSIEYLIKKLPSYKEIIIGEALCRLIDISDIFELVKSLVYAKPNVFNCNNFNCPACNRIAKISDFFLMNRRVI